MDSETLTRLAMADSRIKITFGGVFPRDKLPHDKIHFRSFIINTDLSTDPGQHWQSIFFESNGKAIFFCSYGKLPNKEVKEFIMRNSKCFTTNPYKFQHSKSRTCGLFCLYFLWHKSRGLKIQRMHASDTCANERLLQAFTRRHLNKLTHFKIDFVTQTCESMIG